jgi:hypothetical protein
MEFFLMRVSLLSAAVLFVVALAWAGGSGREPGGRGETAVRTPVLVELFTSEGCSSCPPADAFLQKLDQQPVAGAEMIVLSEHVDYWNHIGWKDPYSARFYSDRQSVYANRFDLDSPYTPQMVVDGSSEFVGSDPDLARKAFDKALEVQKIAVRLSAISFGPANTLQAHVETGVVPSDADVVVAVALNRAESRVLHGENGGRTLTHTAVVRTMTKIGSVVPGQGFAQDVQVKIEAGAARDNLRVIAFVQEAHQGKVLGAAMERVTGN